METGSRRTRRRGFSRRRRTILLGLLPSATMAESVALSDFSPVLTNLSKTCKAVYTMAIPGCIVNDFTNSQHTCSSSCLSGLVQINNLVSTQCAQDSVSETSIVGLFQLGQAIQLLCNVAVVTQGATGNTGVIPSNTQTTFTSTMTMSNTASRTAITSAQSQTLSPTTESRTMSASNGMIGQTPIQPSSSITSISRIPLESPTSGSTSRSTVTRTTLSGAALESLKSGNTNSGGGSPFDNINNSEAAAMRNLNGIVASIVITSLLGVMLMMS